LEKSSGVVSTGNTSIADSLPLVKINNWRIAMYRYTCVGCKQQTKLAYNERKSPWLCRDCCQLRNWILGKIRGNTIKLKNAIDF
jgi:hypothetical protein